MTKQYGFFEQLAIGEAYERRLDEHFEQALDIALIMPATRMQQGAGIDRIWHLKDGRITTVEYKADEKAGRTGNAFVETISVDTTQKPGWAVASTAMLLAYLVTEPETIYLIAMGRLRAELPRWQRQYRTTYAQNDGYRTHGVLVPLAEFERIATKVW